MGKWPQVEPEINIDGFVLKRFYCISNGLYLKPKHLAGSMLEVNA